MKKERNNGNHRKLCLWRPDWKKYSLLKDKYFRVFIIYVPKSLNMRSEWGNLKECNKYPHVILNIRGRGGQTGIRSCFVPIPNTIVHNFLICTKMLHLDMILFCSNMNCSYSFMVLLHCHVTDSLSLTVLCLPLFTYYLANRRMVSYLLNSIFKLK